MVWRCIATGCSLTHKDRARLFLFPKDPALRKKWAEQVKRTRDKWDGPTDHSVLCNKHFEDSCFEQDSKLAVSMGLGRRKPRLKADAIPTLFAKPACMKRKVPSSEMPAPKRRSVYYEKRERSRIVAAVLEASGSGMDDSHMASTDTLVPWLLIGTNRLLSGQGRIYQGLIIILTFGTWQRVFLSVWFFAKISPLPISH